MKFRFTLLLLVILGIANSANADQLVRRVNDWLIMKTDATDDHHSYCYIVSQPFRTKAWQGNEERNPRFVVVYLGKDQYTMKVNVNFDIDPHKGVIVAIDKISRQLENSMNNIAAHTFSSVQDIALLNDFMSKSGYFTVRSHGTSDQHALDYYSLSGFGKAIRIMTNTCKYK